MSNPVLRTDTIFHPVGQGGFTTGCLSLSQEPRHLRWPELPIVHDQFFWAYDCGSVSHQAGLESEIELLAYRLNGRKLDLLAISHFDKDHISGLIKLLRTVKVDILLLPYAPLQERILSALMAGADAEALEFAIDPVGYVAESADGQVERIILVPQSEGEGAGGETTFPIGPTPETPIPEGKGPSSPGEYLSVDKEYPDSGPGGAPRLQQLTAHSSLSVWGLWEFLPYNRRKWLDEAIAKGKAPKFYEKVGNFRDQLLQRPHPHQALDDLKKLYSETFGKGSKPKNRISLAFSSAPLHRAHTMPVQRRARTVELHPSSESLGDDSIWWEYPNSEAQVVLTGDGSLTREAFSEFAQYFGWRAKCPFAFQVPHHGSKGNYHCDLAREVNPVISVFCAEPSHGPTNHPDFIVYRSFEQNIPIIVDGMTGLHFCSRHVCR